MEYKLNSYKTFRDNGLLVICGMIIALFGMLLPLTRGASYQEEEKSELEQEREPGMINEEGTAQVMPPVDAETPHDRFKQICEAYGLDASKIWTVENHYKLTEGVVACITIAETSGGWRGYGQTNPGNVGNNDRGDRVRFAFFETGLESIGQTLTNKYLGSKKTLGCLSNAGSCKEEKDNGKRYATSEGNREANMVSCLSTIYGKIDPSTFSIRR